MMNGGHGQTNHIALDHASRATQLTSCNYMCVCVRVRMRVHMCVHVKLLVHTCTRVCVCVCACVREIKSVAS